MKSPFASRAIYRFVQSPARGTATQREPGCFSVGRLITGKQDQGMVTKIAAFLVRGITEQAAAGLRWMAIIPRKALKIITYSLPHSGVRTTG
jgi:hypothetical protein